MEEKNIYAAPEAEILDVKLEDHSESPLASRWLRLAGAIIDGVISLCVTIPMIFLIGGFDNITRGPLPGVTYSLVLSLASFIIFLLINYKFLKNDGQTIGKKVVKIKIVALDGSKALFSGHILKRYAFYNILALIPIVGLVLSIISDVIIFGSAKRCGHDYVGGTKVVAL